VNRAFPVAVLGVGAGTFLLGAAIASMTTIPLMIRGRSTVGVVRSFVRVESGESDVPPASYPVIQFHTPDGKAHDFQSNLGSSQGIGQQVEVLYDPEAPSRARVNSFRALWLGPALSGGVGLLLLGALVAFLRLRPSPDVPAWQPE
jgi:Protein of unknown function (DUF3592)